MTASNIESAPRRRRTTIRPIEWMATIHVSIYLIAATWAFGGQADWVRGPLTAFGAIGFFLCAAAFLGPERSGISRMEAWCWIAPFAAFNAITLLACLNPSLQMLTESGETLLAVAGERPNWPSSAVPAQARQALLEFDAIWVSCFNIAFILNRRRSIRILLVVLLVDAVALSVVGTIQKLGGFTGLYFGKIPSPQKYFFATFVYHNHWGAFALLALGAGIGAAWYFARHRESRDVLHSPAFAAIAGLLLIAATIPLSGSRSTTILALAFGLGTFLHWTVRLIVKRRHYRESAVVPVVGSAIVVMFATAAVWYVARDSISTRFALTERQIADMQSHGSIGSRAALYRDTIRMAEVKPWFGWGTASYPQVFLLYNSQHSVDRLPVFYHDAHSDWLQSFAEHGIVGTLLLGATVLLPLLSLRRRDWWNPVSGYLFSACAIIGLYAWIEFPFGNYAVVLVWWTCLFAAVQYARLSERDRLRWDKSPENS